MVFQRIAKVFLMNLCGNGGWVAHDTACTVLSTAPCREEMTASYPLSTINVVWRQSGQQRFLGTRIQRCGLIILTNHTRMHNYYNKIILHTRNSLYVSSHLLIALPLAAIADNFKFVFPGPEVAYRQVMF